MPSTIPLILIFDNSGKFLVQQYFVLLCCTSDAKLLKASALAGNSVSARNNYPQGNTSSSMTNFEASRLLKFIICRCHHSDIWNLQENQGCRCGSHLKWTNSATYLQSFRCWWIGERHVSTVWCYTFTFWRPSGERLLEKPEVEAFMRVMDNAYQDISEFFVNKHKTNVWLPILRSVQIWLKLDEILNLTLRVQNAEGLLSEINNMFHSRFAAARIRFAAM